MRMQQQLGQTLEAGSKETWLSQDVAVSLLQENKVALKRCELVLYDRKIHCTAQAFTHNMILHILHNSTYTTAWQSITLIIVSPHLSTAI